MSEEQQAQPEPQPEPSVEDQLRQQNAELQKIVASLHRQIGQQAADYAMQQALRDAQTG